MVGVAGAVVDDDVDDSEVVVDVVVDDSELKSKLGQPLTIELQLVPSEDPLGTSAVGKPKAELNRSERTK